jgi:hypothetical protein
MIPNQYRDFDDLNGDVKRAESCNTSQMKSDDDDFSDKQNAVHKFTQKEIESMFIDDD